VVARALRIEGGREARRLAEQIEQACHAAKAGKNLLKHAAEHEQEEYYRSQTAE
jgi:hypothetical protein